MGISSTMMSPTHDEMLTDSPTDRRALARHMPLSRLFQKSAGGLHCSVVPTTATMVKATVKIQTAHESWRKRRVWKMWALKRMMDVLMKRRDTGWTFCFFFHACQGAAKLSVNEGRNTWRIQMLCQ